MIGVRKTHPGLFRTLILRGVTAITLGVDLAFNGGGEMVNVIGGTALFFCGLGKIYGAFDNYRFARMSLVIGVIVGVYLFLTLCFGQRHQSGHSVYILWGFFLLHAYNIIIEPNINPANIKTDTR